MGRSGTQRCVLTTFLLIFCLRLGSSLFLHVAEGEHRCFIQHMTEKIELIGEFWTQVFDEQEDEYLPPPPDLIVSVVVSDPENRLVLSLQEKPNGTFSFTSSASGEHRVCLQPSSSPPPPQAAGCVLAVHMTLRSANHSRAEAQLQTLNDLMRLQLRVRQLTDQVQQIQKEMDYLRQLEEDFRNLNSSTNLWIFLWPMLRSIYVVVYVITFTGSW